MKILVSILGIALGLFLVAATVIVSSLFFWGLGALICYTFSLSYNWTFLHGFVIALTVASITGISRGIK